MTPVICQAEEGSRPAADGPDFDRYRVTGYAVTGPHQVLSVSSSKILLFSSPKNIPVSLAGKKVKYMNWSREVVPSSDVSKGKKIFVVRKGKKVLIYLDKDEKRLSDADTDKAKKEEEKK
jgi:hypothetical protein